MHRSLCALWALLCAAHAQVDVDVSHHTAVDFKEGEYYEGRCGPATPPPGGSSDAAQGVARGVAGPAWPMSFRRVTVTGCAPPNNSSYSAILAQRNVSVSEELALLALPAPAQLPVAALAALPGLRALRLAAAGTGSLVPESGWAWGLPALRALSLERVRAAPPPRLDALRLRRSGATSLPDHVFSVLRLELEEPELPSLLGTPLRDCARLRELSLTEVSGELAEGLFSGCGALESLSLRGLRARSLPPALLLGASRLQRLSLSEGRLPALPPDLLAHSSLTELNLTAVGLESLPSELFSGQENSLQQLSLSRNNLRAADLRALRNLTALRVLDASGNPLGDLCADDVEDSVLSNLQHLEHLILSDAQLTRACADWTASRSLRVLDLSRNRVRVVPCARLRVRARFLLTGNPVEHINCTEQDYEDCEKLNGGSDSEEPGALVLDSRLACGCGAYWAARLLRAGGVRARLDPLCAAAHTSDYVIPLDTPLRHVPLAALACRLERCARGCACEAAPAAGGVRARCHGPGLDVRALEGSAREYGQPLVEVRANNAGVTELSANYPLSLQYLDLENNNISRASSNASGALFDGGRRLRLRGNPLRCACDNLPLLDMLRAHRHLVDGYDQMKCPDGRLLEPVTDALSCGAPPRARGTPGAPATAASIPALAAGAVGCVVLLVAVCCVLSRPATRRRLRALGARAGAAPARAYDAFVSHAEADQRFVAEEIVARLEPKWRVCVSYREWAAGAWLPAQIDASVRAARCSLVVLSPRARAALWARAELRAAHAHALTHPDHRLVLILLDVSAAQLRSDEELRCVLDAHAHARWGERRFWTKLERALPAPRAPDITTERGTNLEILKVENLPLS